jgi:hypothetical protein
VLSVTLLISPLAWESTYTLLFVPLALLSGDGARRRGVILFFVLSAAQRALEPLAYSLRPFSEARWPLWPSLSLAAALVLLAECTRGVLRPAEGQGRGGPGAEGDQRGETT